MTDADKIEALARLVEQGTNTMRGFALTLSPVKRDELISLAESIERDLEPLLP